MSRILLANHEASTTSILTSLLKTEGYRVVAAETHASVAELLGAQDFSLSVVGITREKEEDIQLLKSMRSDHPRVPIVVLTDAGAGEGDTLTALKPFACIEKPLKLDVLMSAVQRAVDYDASNDEGINLNLQLETSYEFEDIVAESPAMKSVCAMASRVAGTDVAVLITGEDGNGKSLMASCIHRHSQRSAAAFVPIQCSDSRAETMLFGAPGEAGALEQANGGTILFRNVDGLDARVQHKLSTALKDRSFLKPGTNKATPLNARVITSTDKDLGALVKQGTFSDALYKHVKVIVIDIPPLRSRHTDVMPTVRLALRKVVGDKSTLPTLDSDLNTILEAYPWPGNTKEVISVMEDAVKKSKGGKLTRTHLPPKVVKS